MGTKERMRRLIDGPSSAVLEEAFYRTDLRTRRRIVRAALAWWRKRNPRLRAARPVHDGYFGWVMRSVEEEGRNVARVLDDCILPYLREEPRQVGL